MTNLQKAIGSLQDKFISKLDDLESVDLKTSQESNQLVLEQLKKRKFKEELKTGYLDMAQVNLKLATENFELENKTFFNYEARLPECD